MSLYNVYALNGELLAVSKDALVAEIKAYNRGEPVLLQKFGDETLFVLVHPEEHDPEDPHVDMEADEAFDECPTCCGSGGGPDEALRCRVCHGAGSLRRCVREDYDDIGYEVYLKTPGISA